MFQLDVRSRKSIYEQVVDNLKELILSGVLKEDDKLPSVRDLSGQLTVNPNTVQKAYRELERQGYVYTTSGLGTFVAGAGDRTLDHHQLGEVLTVIKNAIKELQYLGLSRKDAEAKVNEIFNERRDWR